MYIKILVINNQHTLKPCLYITNSDIAIIGENKFILKSLYSWKYTNQLMLTSRVVCQGLLTRLIISSPDPKGHVSYCHHWASVVHPLTFHILINSSEATRPIWTKLWWNGPWMAPFQICVRWSRLPTKMAAKLKIEKRGYEILIVHCCFSISQNELKF